MSSFPLFLSCRAFLSVLNCLTLEQHSEHSELHVCILAYFNIFCHIHSNIWYEFASFGVQSWGLSTNLREEASVGYLIPFLFVITLLTYLLYCVEWLLVFCSWSVNCSFYPSLVECVINLIASSSVMTSVCLIVIPL